MNHCCCSLFTTLFFCKLNTGQVQRRRRPSTAKKRQGPEDAERKCTIPCSNPTAETVRFEGINSMRAVQRPARIEQRRKQHSRFPYYYRRRARLKLHLQLGGEEFLAIEAQNHLVFEVHDGTNVVFAACGHIGRRHFFCLRAGKYFRYAVHDEPHLHFVNLRDDDAGLFVKGARLLIQLQPDINHRHHLAAQVHNAENVVGQRRNHRNLLHADDLDDILQFDPVQGFADIE